VAHLLHAGNPANTGGAATSGDNPATNARNPANTAAGGPPAGTTTGATNTGAESGGATVGGTATGASTAGGAVVPGSALNPDSAMGNVILDYYNKAHKWIYEQTIKSLSSDPKDRFDLQATMIQIFLTLISIRLQVVGNLVLNVLGRNLCHCHGEFTLDHVEVRCSE
jgi:hypothetical protein